MFVYGVPFVDVDHVVRDVSVSLYGGNIAIRTGNDRSNRAGPHSRFTLQTVDTAGQGAKGSGHGSGTGPKGLRRTISACWHAHYDVLAELLRRFPDARIVTALATYTSETFRTRALSTAGLNMGSQMYPVTAPECCVCDHSEYTDLNGRRPTTTVPDCAPAGEVFTTRTMAAWELNDAMRPNVDVDYFLDQLDRVLAE
jgi:hypothetical protein